MGRRISVRSELVNTQTAVVDALAAYRLTRLVTKDVILDGPREAIVRWAYCQDRWNPAAVPPGVSFAEFAAHDGNAPKLATLITCRWCAGFYVSVGVVIARRWIPGVWDPIARALALSAGAALIARIETD